MDRTISKLKIIQLLVERDASRRGWREVADSR